MAPGGKGSSKAGGSSGGVEAELLALIHVHLKVCRSNRIGKEG